MPQPRKHEPGGIYYNNGESQATYTEGDVVEFNVVLTAYHKGDFRFRVCRIEGTTPEDERAQLSEQCFDEHVLEQADVGGAQSPGTARYFIGPTSDNWNYKIKYQLPDGLSCDGIDARCVLQWHYVTGNSCDPPGTPSKYGSSQLPVCSSGDGAVPEVRSSSLDKRVVHHVVDASCPKRTGYFAGVTDLLAAHLTLIRSYTYNIRNFGTAPTLQSSRAMAQHPHPPSPLQNHHRSPLQNHHRSPLQSRSRPRRRIPRSSARASPTAPTLMSPANAPSTSYAM